VRQRKLLTQLENARTTRVKPEEVIVPDLSQINLASFKQNDKRQLLEIFFSDERVQVIIGQLLTKAKSQQTYDQPPVGTADFEITRTDNNLERHLSGATSFDAFDLREGNQMARAGTAMQRMNHGASRVKFGYMNRPATGKPKPIVGGGGLNIYQRLVDQNPKDLIKPTASALARSIDPSQNTLATAQQLLNNVSSHGLNAMHTQGGSSTQNMYGRTNSQVSGQTRPQSTNIY
jgi:hypothetical protein